MKGLIHSSCACLTLLTTTKLAYAQNNAQNNINSAHKNAQIYASKTRAKIITPETLAKWQDYATKQRERAFMQNSTSVKLKSASKSIAESLIRSRSSSEMSSQSDILTEVRKRLEFRKKMREKQKTKILEHEAAFSSDGLSEFNFSPGFARAMVSDSVGGIGEYDELDAQLEKELIERPRCGDLFSLMSSDHVYKDGVEFQKAIPIFDVGLIMVNMDLDINSGLEYSQKTYNDCNGMNGEEGSECELICPSLDSGIPRGQYDADKNGASNKFQCMCSQDTLTNDYICYWRPLEKIWHREFTCNSTRQLSTGNKSRQRLKLTSWWKNSDSAEWRWDDAVNRYKEFLMDDDEHMDGEHHKRHNKNRHVFASRPGEFSDLFSEPLENDLFLGSFQKPHEKSNLQSQLLNDDDYSTIEKELNHLEQMQDPTFSEKISRQKYRKMKHMAEVVAYFQTDRSFSKFYEYGCHCWQDRSGMMLSGGGKPVDAIDKSCMQHKQCSKCAKIDFGEECHEYRGYRMIGNVESSV